MSTWKGISRARTALILIAVGWYQAGCGGSGTSGEPDVGENSTSSQAEGQPAGPTGLAAEPILYSDGGFSYVGFRHDSLTDLHATLSDLVGNRIQLRVIPYVGSTDTSGGKTVLKGETLYVFVQEPDADLTAVKARADRVIATVQEAFPELGANYNVRVNARLPTGSTVAELNPDLREACGDRNMVQTQVSLAEFELGNPDARFEFLCDGAKVLNPFFLEEDWDHLPGAWRTTDQIQE